MATFDLESSVNALPDTPIIPNFPGHPVVKAKILEFSMFKGFEPIDIKDKLLQYFNSSNMLVIKHTDTPQPDRGSYKFFEFFFAHNTISLG